jgi:putative SOS response-associated peptidase YedK
MCGRSTITASEKVIEVRLGAEFKKEDAGKLLLPNYNVTPTTLQAAITNLDATAISLLQWGLIPSWAKDKKVGYRMINARVETVSEKSAFKVAFRQRRCLIPMDGYYEWMARGNTKQPYRIVTTDQQVFTCAGLWEEWIDPQSGEVVRTYTIITLPASERLAPIHDRMPAIMPRHLEKHWLDNSLSTSDLLSLITSYPDDLVHAYPVSMSVGNVRNNDPSLINPVDDPPEHKAGQQGTLF